MARLGLRCAAAATWLLFAACGGTAAAFTDSLGNGVYYPPNMGVCPTSSGSPEASCTVLQLRPGGRDRFDGRFEARSSGVITKWWVATGPASPATSAVQLRLRVFDGLEPVPGAQTRYRRLPIEKPGVHKFLARLPIARGQQIALDVAVRGSRRGTAAAPIARSVRDVREIDEWAPPLGLGRHRPSDRLRNAKLLLLARVEPDFDGDGWGDWTQDGCRFDPRRHSACLPDRVKPRIRVSYAPRQDFVARHKLFLRIRTDEYGNVFAGGLLNIGDHAYGLYGSEAWLGAGDSAIFPVYVNGLALRAARRAVAKGGHPSVEVTVYASDASGNQIQREFEVRWKRG
ncbi:MAG TPA: hypothetical protein VFK14_10015 [Solirubrobacterales bacterium]|nr:hypothetical protein [Solirubrobacterales bacterium]